MKTIKGFRMRTGEDVTAELVEENGEQYYIKRPVVPVTVPERDQMGNPLPDGREMLHFMKWVPYATNEEFAIPLDAVVIVYDVAKEIEDYYLQATSNIQIAQGQPPKPR